ncbi:MAG: VOC family protein [Actinomycetota bacterium]
MIGFFPYLYFDGNCREAFTLYHEIFGGGDLIIMSGSDAPPDAGIPEDKMDQVMHASLKIGNALLMASDSYEEEPPDMTGMFVHFSTQDLGQATSVFAALSEGGEILQEGRAEFWTPFFGIVIDRFGTPWHVSAEPSEGDG